MKRKSKEQLKLLVLTLLILTSIIQVGILWGQQNHGLPIPFLSGIMNMGAARQVSIDSAKEVYFSPYRIIVPGLQENTCRIVDRDSHVFQQLWDEAKLYLTDILKNSKDIKSRKSVVYTESEWSSLASKKSFVFEFKSDIPVEFISWYLNLKNAIPSDLSGITKMIILPNEDVNESLNTVYLLNEKKGRIYQYSIQIGNGKLNKTEFLEVIDEVGKVPDQRDYELTNEYLGINSFTSNKTTFTFRPDLLVITGGPKYEKLNTITSVLPEGMNFDKVDTDWIAQQILDSEKERYDSRILDEQGNSSTVVFTNPSNAYKVHSNGVLEYNYLPALDESDKGNIGDAFTKVVDFIERVKPLAKGIDHYYISSIEGDGDTYKFTFNYIVGKLPVFVHYKISGQNNDMLKDALTIEANGKRVISCQWVLSKLVSGKKSAAEYEVRFGDLVDKTFDELKAKSNKDFAVDEMEIGYELSELSLDQSVEPVWIIKTKDGEYYPIQLVKKQGE